jgi:alpha-ketoglutarate-dependent taurine dioxygenase
MLIIEDIDLNTATAQEIKDLVNLCAKHTAITIRNQNLSVEREAEIVKMFPNPYVLFKPNTPGFTRSALDKEGYIGLVTENSIAGHKEEMLWHNESPHARPGSGVAWLYGEQGVEGSTTVWNTTIEAYKDLDSDTKDRIKDLKVITFGNVNHSVERTQENFKNRTIYEDTPFPLVYTNHIGQSGLFLSLHQFERFEGMTRDQSLEIAEPLFDFVTQDKYCHVLEWKTGDVSLSDQWVSVHKRLHFESMNTRRVHRATFDYPVFV